MGNRLMGILAIAMVVIPAMISAQTPSEPGTSATTVSVPDFSGIWVSARKPRAGYQNTGFSITGNEPSFTPWGAEKYKAIRQGPKRNQFDRGNEALDPSLHCLPYGPTRGYVVDHPFEIVQSPGQVHILFEQDHGVRRVYMDGRGHEGMYATFIGHSTGKYDGDTLVVDTAKLNDLTWIDSMGHLHSDALHIVETIRRLDHDTLQIDFTFDDPKVYTKPWTGKRVFELMKGPNAEILESITCEDHLWKDHVPRLLRGENPNSY